LHVEAILDDKHKQLLEQGIISPPSPPSLSTSPSCSPRVYFTDTNFSLYTSFPSQRVPTDLLSTFDDVEQEITPSDFYDGETPTSTQGRFAPNPFQMISGGDIFNDRLFAEVDTNQKDLYESPTKLIGRNSPIPQFVHQSPNPNKINKNYFEQQKRRTSTFPSPEKVAFSPNQSSAFSSYTSDNDS